MDLETRLAWPVDLEIRQSGRKLSGTFFYDRTAVTRDRGRVRKERIAPDAFSYAVNDPDREITLLLGHDFNNPLATKLAGSLELESTPAALRFAAQLPDEAAQTIAQVDAVKQVRQGLVRGLSPGFRVPPKTAVANAERLEDEVGNPGVQIRVIEAAVLWELSLVSRPAYQDTEIDVRHLQNNSDTSSKSTSYPGLRVLRWL